MKLFRNKTDEPANWEALNWVRTSVRGRDWTEDVNGVNWCDTPAPPRNHPCRPQTRGWIGLNYVERCACGAFRDFKTGPWVRVNEKLDHKARDEAEARLPRVTVTCLECGNDYEAAEGTRIARSRQCSRCWAQAFVAAHDAGARP